MKFNFNSLKKKLQYNSIVNKLSQIKKKICYIFKGGGGKSMEEKVENETRDEFYFLSDNPIMDFEEDKLEITRFIENLSEKIINNSNEECIVIGLSSPWGTGKSSCLNLLESRIKNNGDNDSSSKDPIVIRFNPWNFNNFNQLTQMFFEEIKMGLGKDGKALEIGKKLTRLSKALTLLKFVPIPIIKDAGDITGTVAEIIREEKTIEELKKDIDGSIQEYGHKIIIFIDDIDRLDNESIKNIFRLVNLNANFYNTTYIMAFDRSIVEKALCGVQSSGNDPDSGKKYLEKIVQIMITLPDLNCSKYNLEYFLNFELEKVLVKNQITTANWDSRRWANIYGIFKKNLFTNIREIKRYVNTISLTLPLVVNEINVVDFLTIELIRLYYPKLYQELPNYKHKITGIRTDLRIEDFTKSYSEKLSPEEIVLTTDVIKQLFPVFEGQYTSDFLGIWRKENRICHSSMFDRYFVFGLPKGNISNLTINEIIGSIGEDAFIDKLKSLQNDLLVDSLLDRITDYIADIPDNKVGDFIMGLLDFGDEWYYEPVSLIAVDTASKISIVSIKLLEKLDNNSRINVINKCLNSGKGLCTTVHLSRFLEDPSTKFITKEDKNGIRNTIITRIKREIDTKEFWDTPNLKFILYTIKDYFSDDELNSVKDLIKKHNNYILKLLSGCLYLSISQSIDEYYTDRTYVLDYDLLKYFIDVNELYSLVPQIEKEFEDRLPDKEKEAIKLFKMKYEK